MNINEMLDIMALTFWSYRIKNENEEDDFITLVRSELGMEAHVTSFDDGAYLCGVAYRPGSRNVLYKFERGTGGFDRLAELLSWARNANILKGDDNQCNGPQDEGNRSFDQFKSYIENAQRLIIGGHSKGSRTGQRIAWLSCRLKESENLRGLKHVSLYQWAAFPLGDQSFANVMQQYVDSGLLENYLFSMPGDPANSELFHDEDNPFLDGVDTGEIVKLPQVVKSSFYKKPDLGLRLIAHSCTIQSFAMLSYLVDTEASIDQIVKMNKIIKYCTN